MIIDGDERNMVLEHPGMIAERIAGSEYCFHASRNINRLIPDAAKNKLFFSDEELYAAVPEMRPPSSSSRRRASMRAA
jgi:hypothetical protein